MDKTLIKINVTNQLNIFSKLPEKSTRLDVHDWPTSILHPMLQVLTWGLHRQGLWYRLEQLSVALGAAVTPLASLAWFTLMLHPGIVQTHPLL